MKCNMCGKELDMWDKESGLEVSQEIGYGSQYDGCSVHIHLCCECSDKLMSECLKSPVVSEAS